MNDQLDQAIIDGDQAGGAPVTRAYADEIGADGCGANAGMALEWAKELVG